MSTFILNDPQVQAAMQPFAVMAPHGFKTLYTLGDETLMRILTHPDSVKIVWPERYLIDLPEVDSDGYTVYDRSFSPEHSILLDPEDPGYDVEIEGARTMRFGRALLDQNFMLHRAHGDIFFIGYTSNDKLPRSILVVVTDPAHF